MRVREIRPFVLAVLGMVGGALLGALPANAASYLYQFQSFDSQLFASGIFDVDGTNQIVGVTSTITGFTSQNTGANGIVSNPTFPTPSYSPGGAFIYNNLFSYPGQPYLDYYGVLFTTLQNTPGTFWNLFFDAGAYQLYQSLPGGGYAFRDGYLSVTATPLPAALVLFGSGLAGLTWLGRRRRVANVR